MQPRPPSDFEREPKRARTTSATQTFPSLTQQQQQRPLPSLSANVRDLFTDIAFGSVDFAGSFMPPAESPTMISWCQPLVFNQQRIRFCPMLADYRTAYIKAIMQPSTFQESLTL